jgi:hypothetical protein
MKNNICLIFICILLSGCLGSPKDGNPELEAYEANEYKVLEGKGNTKFIDGKVEGEAKGTASHKYDIKYRSKLMKELQESSKSTNLSSDSMKSSNSGEVKKK